MYDPVEADLNRFLKAEDMHARWEEAVEKKAMELRGEWTMQLWQDEDSEWGWMIQNEDGEDVAQEWVKTEREAWQGLQNAMDSCTRAAAEEWLEVQRDDSDE